MMTLFRMFTVDLQDAVGVFMQDNLAPCASAQDSVEKFPGWFLLLMLLLDGVKFR